MNKLIEELITAIVENNLDNNMNIDECITQAKEIYKQQRINNLKLQMFSRW